MSFDIPRKSAEELITAWGGLPIAYDNVKFKSEDYDEWVRIVVLNGESFESAVGSDCVRHTGIVSVQVFTKQWDGSASAREYADQIAATFKGVVDQGVIYHAATLTRVGHDGDFYQCNVTMPFIYDEH